MHKKVKGILDAALGCDVVLELPKNFKTGHFATPQAFILAKKTGQNPRDLALSLSKSLENIAAFERVTPINGFINITLSDDFLAACAREALESPQNFAKGSHSGKILLEFVSANPTGPLHIGHARGAIFGDCLARIARHLGYALETEYYINDAGNQIELLGESVFFAALGLLGRDFGGDSRVDSAADSKRDFAQDSGRDSSQDSLPDSPLPRLSEDCYKGDYIIDLAREAIAEFGEAAFLDAANLAAQNATAPLRHLAKAQDESNICQETPRESNFRASLAAFATQKMLSLIKQNLAAARISFDHFVSEKALVSELPQTLARLEKNGATFEAEGKIWLKSSQKGDEKDRVIVRENGAPTYLAGDIVYHNNKFSRDFERYINIWGADHHGYVARIKACVEFLGFDSGRLEVLLSQMVSLLKDGKPYKMSKRAGNFILMHEIIEEIGTDALRFVFMTKKADTHLEFDLDSLKREDSTNPIYYINYANARIHTVLAKAGADSAVGGEMGGGAILGAAADSKTPDSPAKVSKPTPESFDFSRLNDDWKELLIYALNLGRILEGAFEERGLQKLPEYLKNLAAKLHFCYNNHKIIGGEPSILVVLKVVSLSLTTGLGLMGIVAKTKM